MEHAEELEKLARTLTEGLRLVPVALANMHRHNTALTCGLVFLVTVLERRGYLDRGELAEMAIEGARLADPDDPALEQMVRDLFTPAAEPGKRPHLKLRVIDGGQA